MIKTKPEENSAQQEQMDFQGKPQEKVLPAKTGELMTSDAGGPEAVAASPPAALQTTPDLTDIVPLEQIQGQIKAVRDLYKGVMVEATKANGMAGDYGTIPGTPKPTLLKPGAEKLAFMFKLAPDIETTMKDLGNGHREIRAKCRLIHTPSGVEVGNATGSCSTMETKYYKRRDGSFQHAPDNYNTVLKMACKRAFVAAVLSVTGASMIFTQDVEDMPKGGL